MLKSVLLCIDQGSWTNAPTGFQHPCPREFLEGAATEVDVLGSLLQVGILTVPPKAAACSLAAYWAHVRYLTAIDLGCDYLRLRSEWEQIDAHQKTILSDDWGVGFTMHWLSTRLCYREFCDGRYFIDRLKGLGIAHVKKPPKKRGTYKCPDFVTRDASGKYHLIECKGTQSGSKHLSRQLKTGVNQKANILFENEQSQVGQRLVVGLSVCSQSSKEWSTLAIADPPPRDRSPRSRHHPVTVHIEHAEPSRIADPLVRADMARHLQLSGAPNVAAELFRLPARGGRQQHDRRLRFKESLKAFQQNADAIDDLWVGRTVNVPLAEPLTYNDKRWRGVRLTHAVSQDFVKALSEYDPARETLTDQLPQFGHAGMNAFEEPHIASTLKSEDDAAHAVVHRSGVFYSELALE